MQTAFLLQEEERELMAKVRSGEKDSAEKLLDHLLITIINHNTGNLGDVKARIIELLVMISAPPWMEGIDSKEIRNLNSRFYEELYAKRTTEEICYWTKNVVSFFSEEVRKAKGNDNFASSLCSGRIHPKTFSRKLSIQSIAEVVHLSPSYLSHIFSQTFGYTITDYVTYIRLEIQSQFLSKAAPASAKQLWIQDLKISAIFPECLRSGRH